MKKKYYRTIALLTFMLFLFPATILAEKTVVIDPGHGGKFPGTCGYSGNQTGFCEKDAVLLVSLKLKEILETTDINVHLTRTTDKEFASYLSGSGGDMEKRMEFANGFATGNNDNSVFVSVHFNAHPTNPFVRGIETYYYDGVNHYKSQWPPDPMQLTFLDESKRFAELVHPNLINNLGLIDRKVRNDKSFYVIRNAQMPAILVELGFMTNPDEEALIKTKKFQQQAAQSLADSIIKYFQVFEVFDKDNNKLRTYENKDDAINYAKSLNSFASVFDKDKQKVIFATERNYEVQHRTDGALQKFYTLDEAIDYASSKKNTRVVALETNWTVWSNFLKEKYDVLVNDNKIASFLDYNNAHDEARNKSNAKIVNNLTGDVLWTNQSNVDITRNLASTKLAGQTRYITAVEVSKWIYPNGFPEGKEQKVVILATGQDPADGLSAGPLSPVYGDAPILLTQTNNFTQATKEELLRLQAEKVIILGGHLAIEDHIEEEINALGIETERISGRTRYDTNRMILERLDDVNGIFVASGTSFADAMAAAPIAAANNWGIVLTSKSNISDDALSLLDGKDVVVLGGHLVISDKVENKINNYKHIDSVVRLAGRTRYDTLSMLLNIFSDKVNSNQIIVTTGTNFPDALASAPMSIHSRAPLILVGNSLSSSVELFLMEYAEQNNVEDIFVIGKIVKDSVIEQVTNTVR